MERSRLTSRSLKQSKKQFYGSLIGIVVLISITLNFGPYLIGGIGNLIDTITGKSKQTIILRSDASLEPPVLDSLSRATPSELIDVTGRSFYPDGKVELFVNDLRYSAVEVDKNLDFEIKDIKLSSGENTLKVRVTKDGKNSAFSKDYKISYLKDEPKLEITTPQDKASFSKEDQETKVQGKTDPDNTVRVNGFIAIVDFEGNFSYVYKLSEGENKLTITSENSAGKVVTKEITVSYSP